LNAFAYNDFDIWKKNFSQFPFVKPIKADCAEFDYREIAPLKLSFLDVDLYLPIKGALPKLYDATIVGGTIVVDEVLDNDLFDGAYQAYMEFCRDRNINPKIISNRYGVISKTN